MIAYDLKCLKQPKRKIILKHHYVRILDSLKARNHPNYCDVRKGSFKARVLFFRIFMSLEGWFKRVGNIDAVSVFSGSPDLSSMSWPRVKVIS